jgi:glucose-6-phosphate isomerase
MTPTYNNLDKSTAFTELKKHPKVNLKESLTPARIKETNIPVGAGLIYNYAAKAVNASIVLPLFRN